MQLGLLGRLRLALGLDGDGLLDGGRGGGRGGGDACVVLPLPQRQPHLNVAEEPRALERAPLSGRRGGGGEKLAASVNAALARASH